MAKKKVATKKNKKVTVGAVPGISTYRVSVLSMGRTYTSTGGSVAGALSAIQIRNPKGKSVIVVEKGDLRKERILMPLATLRLFNSAGITKEVALKNASMLFDGI